MARKVRVVQRLVLATFLFIFVTFLYRSNNSIPTESILDEISFENILLRGPPSVDDSRILNILKNQYLVTPSDKPYNFTPRVAVDRYYPKDNRSSFNYIDHYVQQLFHDQFTGFFVEAGALDGQIFSNSLWLEKERGWKGLLVEPDPVNFQHLTWKRRKAWLSNTCLSRTSYPQQIVFESLEPEPEEFDRSWVYRSNSRSIDSAFSKQEDYWGRSSRRSYFQVQCFPLASYLLSLGVNTLDFLSLDIQGYEWEVIKSIPLDKIKVRVIAVEYLYVTPDNIPDLGTIDSCFVKYMNEAGYYLIDLDNESNYIWALKNDFVLKEKKIIKYSHANR